MGVYVPTADCIGQFSLQLGKLKALKCMSKNCVFYNFSHNLAKDNQKRFFNFSWGNSMLQPYIESATALPDN